MAACRETGRVIGDKRDRALCVRGNKPHLPGPLTADVHELVFYSEIGSHLKGLSWSNTI